MDALERSSQDYLAAWGGRGYFDHLISHRRETVKDKILCLINSFAKIQNPSQVDFLPYL